jgi:UPF0271 protein
VTQVDLNADMGEGYGRWTLGDDAALMQIITSANVACGGHAGDPDVMERTFALAARHGVGIGAHPGFADVAGFGRFRMHLPRGTLQNMIRYQVAAHVGMARAFGHRVRHLKLHGALANMCSEDAGMAEAAYEAALSVAPDLIVMVLARTAQEEAVRTLGCAWVGEIFADRAYNDDATLVDRSNPGAVIHDPAAAGPRIAQMVREGAIITQSGKRIPASIDTICVHGDTPQAIGIARAVRTTLESAEVTIAAFGGRAPDEGGGN